MAARVPSSAVIAAARALGVRPEALAPLPGASGQTWDAGRYVLRVRQAAALDAEIAAWAAAASAVPSPQVVHRVDLGAVSAVLIRRLPGTPAGRVDQISPGRSRKRGQACGQLHRILNGIAAPAVLPDALQLAAWPGRGPVPGGDRLLHLDLHPFNVLVDEGDEVSGVLDWANAGAGHPVLDRARSWSILTLDPAAVARRSDPRWAALADGWIESGQLGNVPSPAVAWACRFMLGDLAGRYDRQQLAAVAAALHDAERRTP